MSGMRSTDQALPALKTQTGEKPCNSIVVSSSDPPPQRPPSALHDRPAGGCFHSEREYLRVDTIENRVRMLSRFLPLL